MATIVPPMPANPLTPEQLEDAQRIRDLFQDWQIRRKEAGLPRSQEAAAQELGFNQSAFSQYMRGKIPLNLPTLFKLANLFSVSPDRISPTLFFSSVRNLNDITASNVARITDSQPARIAGQPTDVGHSYEIKRGSVGAGGRRDKQDSLAELPGYPVDARIRRVYVLAHAVGEIPERLWTDGDELVGVTEKFAELATADRRAFLTPVIGTSMSSRYNHGEFALVEPSVEPELEDDVFIRLKTGEAMLRRLVSRRGGIQLAAYNEPGTQLFQENEISWMYYVAHPVPARKIQIGQL